MRRKTFLSDDPLRKNDILCFFHYKKKLKGPAIRESEGKENNRKSNEREMYVEKRDETEVKTTVPIICHPRDDIFGYPLFLFFRSYLPSFITVYVQYSLLPFSLLYERVSCMIQLHCGDVQ